MSAVSTIQKLASLIEAGMHPRQAESELLSEIDQMPSRHRSQFDLIWNLAQHSGGAVGPALNHLAEVIETQDRFARQIEISYSAPKATARLIMVLPLAALLIEQLLGLNPVRAIFNQPIGLLAAVSGILLLWLGQRWSKRLLTKAQPSQDDPGSYFDCIAICLRAGMPLELARQTTELHFERHLSTKPSEKQRVELENITKLAARSGLALNRVLEPLASSARTDKHTLEEKKIAALSVRLMLPLGLSVLPAFVRLAVLPAGLALISNGPAIEA